MASRGYKNFPSREDGSSSSDKFENLEENPFYGLNAKDNNDGHDEILTEEDKQLGEIILKLVYLNGDEAKTVRAFSRQPDWVLQRLEIQRDEIKTPRSGVIENKSKDEGSRATTKYSPPHMRKMEQPFRTFDNPLLNGSRRWGDVHKDQNEERNRNNQDNGGRNGNEENDGGWNNTNKGRNNNNSNGGNHGNNNNINGGGNNWNNGNYGRNGGFSRGNINNQSNNQGGRRPMSIERYRQLDFTSIVGYPNQITKDLRSTIPKFSGNGIDSAKQHAVNVKNIIEEFEVPHEDIFMKLFVQSLIEDVGEWYRILPDGCINSWEEFVTLFLEEFGDHNDHSFASH
ncbi:uncharacterized protein LOC131857519 [Cryptomeria japonica]|uniref:uncharacterized protein LOC131857519 n=1 Tax=Cryptomeria japonica TaxID=3369 RepID=UPI0027DA3E9E|nr:uncharacterized protein LOC131857519 [Cryptomeria japonica]